MTKEQLNKVFRDFLTWSTGGISIKKNQKNAPLPQDDFFSAVKINTIEHYGSDSAIYEDFNDDDLSETIEGFRLGIAEIDLFKRRGDISVFDLAENLKQYAVSSHGLELFCSNNIGINQFSPVLDLSALENATFEERAQINIAFNFTLENNFITNKIKSVEIEADFQDNQAYSNF